MNQENRFEKINCLFCGTDQFVKNLFCVPDRINNITGNFYLSKCKKCGLVFQNPRIKEEFIKEYYPDETGYYQPSSKTQNSAKKIIEKLVLVNFFGYKNLGNKNIFKKIILYPIYLFSYKSKSFPKFVSQAKLLEIGCSHGATLEKLSKLGWEVYGIEFNKKAAEYAINVRGLSVQNIDFPQNANLRDDCFDAVIMDMTLEHLYKPVESIQMIAKSLKKGGQFIFSIPYFNGLEFKIFGRFSYGIQLPAHINFFNKKNIKNLLSQEFFDVRFNFQGSDRDFVAPFTYLNKEKRMIFLKKVIMNKAFRFFIVKPIVLILSILGLTSRVTIRAIKK